MGTPSWHGTQKSGGMLTVKRGEAAWPKAQLPKGGDLWLDRREGAARKRIPYSILDGKKLWKGGGQKQRTRASVRVGGAKRLQQRWSCWP
jgi:hypothetical protein